MNNKVLMKKLVELDFQPSETKEQSLEVMTKSGIIRRTFGVKDYEIENSIEDYEREPVLSNNEVKAELNKVLDWITYAKERNNFDDVKKYESRAHYFIDAVRFFDTNLADELENQRSF
ncbi:hypothetical protein ABEX78_21695 [Priestia megaterium]